MFYIYLFNVRVGFLSTTSRDTLLIYHLFAQIIITTDLIVQTYLRIFLNETEISPFSKYDQTGWEINN